MNSIWCKIHNILSTPFSYLRRKQMLFISVFGSNHTQYILANEHFHMFRFRKKEQTICVRQANLKWKWNNWNHFNWKCIKASCFEIHIRWCLFFSCFHERRLYDVCEHFLFAKLYHKFSFHWKFNTMKPCDFIQCEYFIFIDKWNVDLFERKSYWFYTEWNISLSSNHISKHG